MTDSTPSSSPDPLLAACQLVGRALGIAMAAPPAWGAGGDPLRQIAATSQVRYRRVGLRGNWWRTDNGPMLAFRTAEGDGTGNSPVALLPLSPGKYQVADPLTGSRQPVDGQTAGQLAPFGYVFYRPLPPHPLSAPDLIRFALPGIRRDLSAILLAALGAGLLSLVTPFLTGLLVDLVIPGALRSQLGQFTLALLVSALAGVLFQISRDTALLRINMRSGSALSAAIWDRLLRLPASFFRQFSAGDLTGRAMGVESLLHWLSSTLMAAAISLIFTLFSLFLMFYYSPILALAAVGMALALAAMAVLAGLAQYRTSLRQQEISGKIAGLVLQLINGMARLRVAGAEPCAFARWERDFNLQAQAGMQNRQVENRLEMIYLIYPVLAMAVFYALLAYTTAAPALTTGSFLAFSAAFGEFLSASLALSGLLVSALESAPLYDRLRPILNAQPEVTPARANPGLLKGELEIRQVSFRYQENGPLVLKDLSLYARPGEFIALVGASGCGKSTLLRLMLGFEVPEAGAVCYDGRSLAELDAEAVRRQIGVVLQDGRLLAGSIFENIVGASSLTLDDAWEAAEMAGLADEIEELPMGMHTIISEGGATFSGGQRQRLLIARAIANRPRFLFFDEATSALDNRSQAVISHSLEELKSTRIVIAHRLSTVLNADRIYVIQNGQVVECGAYSELMKQGGLFAHMAKRQII